MTTPALQDVVDVLDHDPLDVLEFAVQRRQVPPAASVGVRLLGLLDVRVEFDKRVRPGGS